MTAILEIEGLDEMIRMIQPSRLNKATETIVDRGSQIWRDEAKKMPPVSAKGTGYGARGIPVDTGRLRQSIQARRLSAVAAEVYGGVKYSKYVHEGTGKVPPRPFFDWALEFGAMKRIEEMAQKVLTDALRA